MYTKTNEIRIETSTICNYRCVMCARDSFLRIKEVMSNDLYTNIISKVKKELSWINTLTISGFGEFSTDRNWKFKVQYGKKNFEKIHIVTNLALLNFEDLDFVLQYANNIRISIYGTTSQVYNKVHNNPGNINFSEIEKKILHLVNSKSSHQSVILNYIECDINKHQTQGWIDKWKNVVDLIEVWKPHNWVDAKNYRLLCKERMETCGRPFNGPIQVQVDGTINVCCFDYNGEMVIGDLNENSFKDVFHGKEMTRIQKLHKSGKSDLLKLCSICDQRNPKENSANYLLYNSGFDQMKRIGTTSTEYQKMT